MMNYDAKTQTYTVSKNKRKFTVEDQCIFKSCDDFTLNDFRKLSLSGRRGDSGFVLSPKVYSALRAMGKSVWDENPQSEIDKTGIFGYVCEFPLYVCSTTPINMIHLVDL